LSHYSISKAKAFHTSWSGLPVSSRARVKTSSLEFELDGGSLRLTHGSQWIRRIVGVFSLLTRLEELAVLVLAEILVLGIPTQIVVY
jgi:hypothetical protein